MQTMTMGLAATASAALGATAAPLRASASALAGVRFQTVTRWPLPRSVRASAAPIGPDPTTVTSVMVFVSISVAGCGDDHASEAAVDDELGAGGERRVEREEQDGAREFLGRADALHRRDLLALADEGVEVRAAGAGDAHGRRADE